MQINRPQKSNWLTYDNPLAAEEKFDLLISDLGLTDGSGFDLMWELKRLYAIRGIAISGFGADEDLRESRAAGFQQHLINPVSFETLRTAVGDLAENEK